tara:strand:- start:358 stop:1056 length:699 start_codon:yes stop_codon:yes gene_type:complete
MTLSTENPCISGVLPFEYYGKFVFINTDTTHPIINPSKPKKKEDIIRVGDLVQIVNPQVVTRVGYPLNIESVVRNHMTVEQGMYIDRFIASFGIDIASTAKIYDDVVRDLAYGILLTKKFGGNERSIHSTNVPQLAGQDATVVGRRVVKTGIRKTEYDYDSDGCNSSWNYLDKEKTHIIYSLRLHEMRFNLTSYDSSTERDVFNFIEGITSLDEFCRKPFEIEKTNLKKYEN